MKRCGNPLRFAKFIFFILLVSSALVLLKVALQFQEEEEQTADDTILYEPEKLSDVFTRQMLRNDFHTCIIRPSKTFCFETSDGKLNSYERDQNFVGDNFIAPNKSSKVGDVRIRPFHPVHDAFVAFSRLCKKFDIKAVLIEPTVVFCLLNQENQKLLSRRGLNITALMGRENVLTFAINEEDSKKFSDPSRMKTLLPTDFNHWSIQIEDSPTVPSDHRGLKTHHFFIKKNIVIHAVVFYRRHNYLWHGGINMLPNEVLNFTPVENLLFSNTEAIYERFVPVEIPAESTVEALYIPSDPRLFLHQIPSSQLLYCNSSNAMYVNQSKQKDHGDISHIKFSRMTKITIQELKFQLHSELMTFWIMGGTLLGWYRECGIIPYTTDVDFGAWATHIDDPEKLSKKFIGNKHLRMKETMGLPKEALEYKFLCHGLRVDLFFCYDDGEHYWVAGHRPGGGYYFPYNYPKFVLCSADLLGHKVQVPCDTLKVLFADYGSEWVKPISNWNYEVSPKNMGKKHYWKEEERPLAYKVF